MVRTSRSRIFCARTQGSSICTSISRKWSYQSHRCISSLMPLSMTIVGLKTAIWLIASFQRYQSTNPKPYYSHRVFYHMYYFMASPYLFLPPPLPPPHNPSNPFLISYQHYSLLISFIGWKLLISFETGFSWLKDPSLQSPRFYFARARQLTCT